MKWSRSVVTRELEAKMREWNASKLYYAQRTELAHREHVKCEERWEETIRAVNVTEDVRLLELSIRNHYR